MSKFNEVVEGLDAGKSRAELHRETGWRDETIKRIQTMFPVEKRDELIAQMQPAIDELEALNLEDFTSKNIPNKTDVPELKKLLSYEGKLLWLAYSATHEDVNYEHAFAQFSLLNDRTPETYGQDWKNLIRVYRSMVRQYGRN